MHQPLLFSLSSPSSSPHTPNPRLGASKEGAAGSWKLRWTSARCFSILGPGMEKEREREMQCQNKKPAGVQTGQAFGRPGFKARLPQVALGLWFSVEMGAGSRPLLVEVWCHGS